MKNFLRKIRHKIGGFLAYRRYIKCHKNNIKKASNYEELQLQNKVVFNNFEGGDYGDNPKYIAEALIKLNAEIDIVWLVEDINYTFPGRIRKVKFGSDDACKELMTAKVIVNNVKGELNFKKRPDQLYIQTWHAGYSFKTLEYGARKQLPKSYLAESKNESKITDVILSNSPLQSLEYKNNFWCTAEIFECGFPRNDLYFINNTTKKINELKNELGFDLRKKIVIFAPTFRSGEDKYEDYKFDSNKFLEILKETTKEEWLILIRVHPNIKIFSFDENDNIKNVSKGYDMQQLLLISDLLITDYSTSMMDFIQMKKPVILYAHDLEYYNSIRKLKDGYYETGMPICKNWNELKEKTIELLDDKICIDYDGLIDKYCKYDDGHASENVAQRIIDYMKVEDKNE